MCGFSHHVEMKCWEGLGYSSFIQNSGKNSICIGVDHVSVDPDSHQNTQILVRNPSASISESRVLGRTFLLADISLALMFVLRWEKEA